MSDKAILDVEEVISALSRSSLPTVVIEGIDDVVVYRKLEDIFSDIGLSILPVHGRNNVLKIFDRRSEIPNAKKLAFIVDKDIWALIGVPDQYKSENLLFTDGYSIENDIFRDCRVRAILNKEELVRFDADLQKFVSWFVLAVYRIINKVEGVEIKIFPDRILSDEGEYRRQMTLLEGEVFPYDLLERMNSDKERFLRGKSLMQIAARQLLRKGRVPKIDPVVFLGIAPATPGPLLVNIYSKVGEIFGADFS